METDNSKSRRSCQNHQNNKNKNQKEQLGAVAEFLLLVLYNISFRWAGTMSSAPQGNIELEQSVWSAIYVNNMVFIFK